MQIDRRVRAIDALAEFEVRRHARLAKALVLALKKKSMVKRSGRKWDCFDGSFQAWTVCCFWHQGRSGWSGFSCACL